MDAARCVFSHQHCAALLVCVARCSLDGGKQVLYVLAKLSIGDKLAAGPRTADQLAEESGATWLAWRPLSYSEQLASLHELLMDWLQHALFLLKIVFTLNPPCRVRQRNVDLVWQACRTQRACSACCAWPSAMSCWRVARTRPPARSSFGTARCRRCCGRTTPTACGRNTRQAPPVVHG